MQRVAPGNGALRNGRRWRGFGAKDVSFGTPVAIGYFADRGRRLPNDLERAICGLYPSRDTRRFEISLVETLEAHGFTVARRVEIEDRGDGRPGTIALMARRKKIVAAIELACMTPRIKSVHKLSKLPPHYTKAIVLRESGGQR